jgi:CBS domain-containing protein
MHLGQQTVRELMTSEVPTVERGARIEEILDALVRNGSSFVVVVDQGKPVGMVTERTLLPKVAQDESQGPSSLLSTLFHSLGETLEHHEELRKARATTAEEAMSTPIVTIPPIASIAAAVELFEEHNFRQLPVVEGGQLVGVLRQRDIIRALREEIGHHAPKAET